MEHQSRMTDRKLQVVGAGALIVAMFAAMIFLTDSPSLDRCPGARAEDQVPPRLADARYAHAPGLPRPEVVGIRTPVASVLPPPHPDRKLLDALLLQEAYGGDRAVGPDGERGPYQIIEAYWIDACDYAHIDWESYEWCYETHVYDPDKCEFIIWLYMLRHLGPDASDFRKARCHNSGPEDGQDLRSWHYARDVMRLMGRGGD